MTHIIINGVLINKNMLLYAIDGGDGLVVMLENFNGLSANGELLLVTDTNFIDLASETEFLKVVAVDDLLVNYNRALKVTNTQIFFDNGLSVSHTETATAIQDNINLLLNPPEKVYYRSLTSDFDSFDSTKKDVTELQFDVVAGKIYDIEVHAPFISSLTTMGCVIGVRLPSGSGTIFGYFELTITVAVAATQIIAPIRWISSDPNLAGASVVSPSVSNVSQWQNLTGRINFKCVTSGRFSITFGNETTGTATVTLGENGFIKINEMN